MAPSVDTSTGAKPLDDDTSNKAIQADADRVHRAMNSGLRPMQYESVLDTYMHEGFMMVSLYTSRVSLESYGSMQLYDAVKTHLISQWAENREALVKTLEPALGQPCNSASITSMYLGGGGHEYRGLENRPHHYLNTESYIYSTIVMQILTAWDESVRQGSTEFFDHQFADAIVTWNQNRDSDVQPGDSNDDDARSPPGRENRSTGPSRMRATPIANPVLSDEIVVGTWAQSPINDIGPNAVVGIFDRRGHLNYRIVARTVDGIPVPGPVGTSTSLPNIKLRTPYAGLTSDGLRTMIDQHIRLPRDQRP
ncbi:hypothetical protein V492_01085 [Pseudogymnoascus sp. VKM F-4246]|nr:hypothetical protein V492_01085 [Pseudogymnoascus sp. VKM F-4246]